MNKRNEAVENMTVSQKIQFLKGRMKAARRSFRKLKVDTQANIRMVKRLRKLGTSDYEIAKAIGVPDSDMEMFQDIR